MVGDIDFDYDIDLEWDDISNLPCADDDAGTCSDAPDIYIDCLVNADCDDGSVSYTHLTLPTKA